MKFILLQFALFGSLSVFVTLSGCAAMQQDYENRLCNYDGAYEQGANAAREGGGMSGSGIASQCPGEAHDAVMKGYRAGYASVANRPVIVPQPVQPPPFIIVNPPSMGFGYDNRTAPAPPPLPPQQCLESFGKRICGYNCKQAYGTVRCARTPNHACLESYGKIYCGLNCREEYGKVSCDEWD